jgi:hypothetical protein
LPIEQPLPVDTGRPALEHLDVQSIFTEVMELELDFLFGQELPGPPAGIATLDAIYG